MKFALFLLCALFGVCLAQNDGRYRPVQAVNIFASANAGRFSGANRGSSDGRYTPDNSGRYNANDGKYYPDNSGRYNPDGSGAYDGQNGRYNPDGSGAYDGKNGRYNPDGSGAYTGQNDKYQGDKFGAGRGSGSGTGFGKQSGAGTGFGKHSGAGTGIAPAAGFGKPVSGKQGSAAGKYDNRNYAIIRQEGDILEDGYHYLYETENGILGEEQGKLANRGTDAEGMKAHGFYTYTGPDSIVYTVTYTADENGFIPQGDHLPTPPPIPEAILKSLDYQRSQGKL
ncbi:Cuticular protein 49Ab [Carabus blaptoides fortunei]